MKQILPIAGLCYKECLRHKVIYGVAFFSLSLMFFSLFISGLFMRDILKIIIDICMSSISFGGLLVPLFMVVSTLSSDLHQKTMYTILSRNIDRKQYILGKYLGLSLLSFTIMAILTVATFITIWCATFIYDPSFFTSFSPLILLTAILYKFLGVLVLNSIAMLWSLATTSGFLATLLIFCSYFIGQTVEDVVRFISIENSTVSFSQSINILSKISLYIFPNLTSFNFNQNAAYGLPISLEESLFSLLYGISYILSVLIIAIFIINRRDLT